ncbi:hypothetical protein QQP08_012851, partial [Theobroma cacao]
FNVSKLFGHCKLTKRERERNLSISIALGDWKEKARMEALTTDLEDFENSETTSSELSAKRNLPRSVLDSNTIQLLEKTLGIFTAIQIEIFVHS